MIDEEPNVQLAHHFYDDDRFSKSGEVKAVEIHNIEEVEKRGVLEGIFAAVFHYFPACWDSIPNPFFAVLL